MVRYHDEDEREKIPGERLIGRRTGVRMPLKRRHLTVRGLGGLSG